MALPTLDAVFASVADLPRKYMLARWLVRETGETIPSDVLVSGLFLPEGSGDADPSIYNGYYKYDGIVNGKPSYKFEKNENVLIFWSENDAWVLANTNLGAQCVSDSDVEYPWLAINWEAEGIPPDGIIINEIPQNPVANYITLPERYLWAKIAVAAGAPRGEADYISLPKQYAWKDVYDAVSGSSLGTTDWSEKQALGHIAAAYRGDTANPASLATYIDWPWRYQVASIITSLATPTTYNAVIVSGAGSEISNDTYTERGEYNDKPYYIRIGDPDQNGDNISNSASIYWVEAWIINNSSDGLLYFSEEDVEFPWLIETWTALNGIEPPPTLTPTNV
jgi:hypothetical protein